jgi:hypothetical protein
MQLASLLELELVIATGVVSSQLAADHQLQVLKSDVEAVIAATVRASCRCRMNISGS